MAISFKPHGGVTLQESHNLRDQVYIRRLSGYVQLKVLTTTNQKGRTEQNSDRSNIMKRRLAAMPGGVNQP
jgi:hypothetical protein